MTIQIDKVKLRDGMFATVEYNEINDGVKDQVARTCNNPVHSDFKTALQALAVHAVLICELVDVSKVKGDLDKYQPAILQFIKVKNVSINHDDTSGITISFERKLSTGKVINLNTPFTKFHDEQTNYKFDDDLQLAVQDLEKEVIEYLEGKHGEGAQMEMEFTGDEELAEQDHI